MTSPNKGMTNEEIARSITGDCICSIEYTQRSLIDPQCDFHENHYLIKEALNSKDSLLAKERALSDGLAGALEDCRRRLVIHGTKDIEIALQAHKEARK